uniref:Uncharacterized protein n=1 Tax=Arundo donax TaxID=35708 RepID=A0A0A9DAG8_ARUDO
MSEISDLLEEFQPLINLLSLLVTRLPLSEFSDFSVRNLCSNSDIIDYCDLLMLFVCLKGYGFGVD